MSSFLVLAHYCDTHGPTPLMVTEGLSVPCSTCYDDEESSSRRPSASSRSTTGDVVIRGVARTNSAASDVATTPPESPRVAMLSGASNSSKRDSSFRRTYDENDRKRASPCDNCALTMPKRTNQEPNRVDNTAPVLRTRKAIKQISTLSENPSPPKSTTSSNSNSNSSSDSENADSSKRSHRRKHSQALVRSGTSSSTSSNSSATLHHHYLDYTSQHEPASPTSFSIIRQSCLRTLACETMPPSHSQQTLSPTSPFSSQFPSGSSSSSASGGPIFFGDSLAGYTTAFVFRISDPNARGRRRVYALMALSTQNQRAAVQAFTYLSSAFKDLASWIQSLAEAELDRSLESPRGEERAEGSRHSTPTSSFLSGRSRGYDSKFAGMSLKSRGLAEIVGMPDFFIELHLRFVKLLTEWRALLAC